jgi:hypothetical protein
MVDEDPALDDVFEIVIIQAEAMKRGVLTMWTVYAKPKDYPNGFVARLFEVTGPEPKATHYTLKSLNLEPIQEKLTRAGLVCLTRDPSDEPQIVECWL